MSISFYNYIGPFVKCKTDIIPKVKIIKSCSDNCKNIHKFEKYTFCPACGKKLELKEISDGSEPVQDQFEIARKMDENLFYPNIDDNDENYHYFIPNIKTECKTFSLSKYEDTRVVDLSFDMGVEINKFSNQFKNEIEIIKKEYKSVDIIYGCLGYYM